MDIRVFESARPRLLQLAYRMLGSHSAAADVVQDAWVRVATREDGQVRNEGAFLTTIVSRLCLDRLRNRQRETYPGVWLPEPFAKDVDMDAFDAPDALRERSETISLAFLTILEALTPMERAVFVLHDVFDYPHEEIASILQTSAAACRQSLRRAKNSLRGKAARPASVEKHQTLLDAFFETCRTGNVEKIVGLLAGDVVARADGGGKSVAALKPVVGAHAVARLYRGIFANAPADTRYRRTIANGLPAMVAERDGHVFALLQVGVTDDGISNVFLITNPDKLGAYGVAP